MPPPSPPLSPDDSPSPACKVFRVRPNRGKSSADRLFPGPCLIRRWPLMDSVFPVPVSYPPAAVRLHPPPSCPGSPSPVPRFHAAAPRSGGPPARRGSRFDHRRGRICSASNEGDLARFVQNGAEPVLLRPVRKRQCGHARRAVRVRRRRSIPAGQGGTWGWCDPDTLELEPEPVVEAQRTVKVPPPPPHGPLHPIKRPCARAGACSAAEPAAVAPVRNRIILAPIPRTVLPVWSSPWRVRRQTPLLPARCSCRARRMHLSLRAALLV